MKDKMSTTEELIKRSKYRQDEFAIEELLNVYSETDDDKLKVMILKLILDEKFRRDSLHNSMRMRQAMEDRLKPKQFVNNDEYDLL